MSNLKDTRNINCRIAKFKNVLENISDSAVLSYVEELIGKTDSIDNKVIATDYTETSYWIGCTLLHFAVTCKRIEVFFYLLNKGADFTLKNNDGDTALHLAFKDKIFKHDKDVSVLTSHLKKSNLVNICDEYGFSYFHMACMANDVELVQQFLAIGVSIHQAIESESLFFPGYTPLHFSVKYCAFEVAEVLLFHGADTHAKDSRQMTPLHVLMENNFHSLTSTEKQILGSTDEIMIGKIQKIMGLLFESYNNTDILIIDDIGLSNLHVACAIGDLSTARSIIKNNIDINHRVYTDSLLWQGYTALHFAVLFNMQAVMLLMTSGADIGVVDAKGVTAFDLCLKRLEKQWRRMGIIFLILFINPAWRSIVLSDDRTQLVDLIRAMKTPDELEIFLRQFDDAGQIFKREVYIPTSSSLWPGFSLMHLATVLFEHSHQVDHDEDLDEMSIHSMRVILSHNPTLLYKSEIHGWTPLHLAYRSNKQNVVNVLIRFHRLFNCPVNIIDDDGLSYMHIACAKNDKDFLKQLLLHNSNINAVYRGESVVSSTIRPQTTPLHVAVMNSSVKIVEMLLKHGADVNAKDANDMTPIHLSIASVSYNDIATILLSSAALQDSIVSGVGLSHLHVASYRGHLTAMEKLVAAGANVNQLLEKANELSFLSKYVGYTPLSFAIRAGNDNNAVTWLVERGADFFAKMPSGNLLLFEMIDNRFNHLFTLPCVSENIHLQNRARMEIGLTALHLACYNNDVSHARDLLDNGTDVNAKVYETSPSWSGFTPLHAVSLAINHLDGDFNEIIELLIHKGADVTLVNNKSETPLHQVYKELLYDESNKKMFSYVNKLLESQCDFSVNLATDEGITHFHIACSLCNVAVIKEFLEQGSVDVNQPIDVFSNMYVSGYTPLQLACDSEFSINRNQRLQAAKLLLAHGADANTVDSRHGSMLLHHCVYSKLFDLFELLIRYGADANYRNLDGETPLLCLILKGGDFVVENVKTLLRFGCRFNVFNTSTEVGHIGLALESMSYKVMKNLIPVLVVNFLRSIEADDTDRTVIHNIVSVQQFEIRVDQYAELIQLLMTTGCDIDDQDRTGRTALHLAAKFGNFKAISALLMLGADINIIDFSGKSAFTCDLASCNRWGGNDEIGGDDVNDNEDVVDCNNGICQHFQMFKTFAIYVKKLQLCGIDVHKLNEHLATEAYRKFQSESALSESFFKELEELKNVKIESNSLNLSDFMSDNRALVRYPTMSRKKRQIVNKLFSQTQTLSFRKKFSETADILQLQYRKAVARLHLFEKSRNSLIVLIGFGFPRMIYEMILEFLNNSELKMLILTADII